MTGADVTHLDDHRAALWRQRDELRALGDRLDPPSNQPHSSTMTDAPTRGEIDAKLQAAEARTETRFVALQGDIDRRFTEMRAEMDQRFTRVETRIDTLVSVAEGWAREMRETRQTVVSENKATRTNLWITAVGAVIAVVGAIYSIHSLNLATQANLLSAFQAKEAVSPNKPTAPQ